MRKLDFLSQFVKDDDNDFEGENDTNELSVRSEVLKKIDRIASIRIPNDKEELFHLLSELSIHIKATKLSANDDDENRTRNQYYEALVFRTLSKARSNLLILSIYFLILGCCKKRKLFATPD